MAHDAMRPDAASEWPDDVEEVGLDPDPEPELPQRGRHAARSGSTDTHGSVWPSVVYYMALGAGGCLLILSGVFGFNEVINKMDRAGIMVTVLVALLIVMLLVSAVSCLRNRCVRCVWESAAVIAVLAGNWLSWLYRFNLPHEVMQLFS